MRIRTLLGLAAIAAALVIAGFGVFAAWTYANRPLVESVSPAPGRTVNGSTPIRIVVQSPEQVVAARVLLDGRDVSASATRTAGGFTLPMPKLPDGPHRVSVSLASSNAIADSEAFSWSFRTDRTPPRLAPATRSIWSTSSEVAGATEPDASVTVAWATGEATTTADGTGRFSLVPALPEGVTPITITATDAAGNRARASRTLRVDSQRPRVKVTGVDGWVRDTDRPRVYTFVDSASPTTIVAKVNGQDAKVTPLSIGYTIETSRLPQGRSTLEIAITNALGRTTTRTTAINIDSTETLTNNLTLMPGARGDDVVRLTRRLRVLDAWEGKPSRRYDERVFEAVKAYQAKIGLPADGIARPALLMRTGGKIVVIQHLFKLRLFLDGRLAKTYPVAVGQPAYPTPTGDYVVTEKIENPTWSPPNSPWAAGLEPIAPGPGNPLGTRWIGTSAPLVGIHGTPQDWSIGSAASHGCIRMHISDVEDLYPRVTVGMPIEIRP
jgi:peptidoglycan hydrolase-like protein with peptidoglycan-binding domain